MSKHPGDKRDLTKVIFVDGKRDVYFELTQEQFDRLSAETKAVSLPHAIRIVEKSPQDLIVYMDKNYYYLTKTALVQNAVQVVPGQDLEASEADSLRRRGTLVAHMDEQPPVGEWTTLVNLDAIIAGVEDTGGG